MQGVIDIGNTQVKWALFANHTVIDSGKTQYGDWQVLREQNEKHKPEVWILSSVQSQPDPSELGFSYECIVWEGGLPIKNHYGTPQSLGKDRLSAVCGAWHLFPGAASLAIDAGTCLTFDFIDAQGIYYGGSISLGLQMRLKAMNAFTDRLPLLTWSEPEGIIGNDTRSCMLQGVKQGLIGEVERQIAEYRKLHADLNVLITGGDAAFFEKNLKKEIFAAPNLVLIGLNAIYLYKQSLHA